MAGYPGKQGRKPTPTHLKAIAGNPGKRPLNDREPPANGTPSMPRGMSSKAQAEWRLLTSEMHPALQARMDQSTLMAHCETVSLFWVSAQDVAKNGPTIMVESGRKTDDDRTIYVEVKANPAVNTMLKCAAQIRGFCAEFGLSAAARGRIAIPEATSVRSEVEQHFG